MRRVENIYLIGLMGVGKTTIGRQLARSLKLPFYDSDKAIEEQTGVDIATIFEFEGEEGFRRREVKMIQQLTSLKGVVLATGGGAILSEQSRNLFKENGFVVYLQCSIDRILERTRRDSKRPLLQVDNPKQRLIQLLEQRDPLYLACSDFRVDTSKRPGKEVGRSILKAFRSINDCK